MCIEKVDMFLRSLRQTLSEIKWNVLKSICFSYFSPYWKFNVKDFIYKM